MATIQKRNSTYYISVSLGYNSDGSQIRKTMTWRPSADMTDKQIEKALQKAANTFEEKVKHGFTMENCTLKEYIEKWLENKKAGLSPKTIEHYTELTKRIYEHLGHIRLNKILPIHVQDFYRVLATEKGIKTGQTLSAETQRHYHRFLSSVLREAFKLQIIDKNIMAHVSPPKIRNKPPVKILDDEQAKIFVSALLNETDLRKKTAFLLLIYSGCRIAELLGLEWSDINFKDHTITICRTSQYLYTQKRTITTSPKTRESRRIISLPAELFPVLKEYRTFWFEYSQHIDIQCNRLFIQQSGKPMFPTTINTWLKKILVDNDLLAVSVHSLRHTCITLQILAGIPLRQVSARAGHANQTTTANIYSHALQTADKMAAEKLAEALPLAKIQ